MKKSTSELISILSQEMNACIKGERVLPFTTPVEAKEIVVKKMGSFLGNFLKPEKLIHITHYYEFRDLVWKYQEDNQISGLVKEHINLGDRFYTFLAPHDQLILIESDRQILKTQVKEIVEAFIQYTVEANAYLFYKAHGKRDYEWHIQTNPETIRSIVNGSDWATINRWEHWKDKDPILDEVVINIGWGKYESCSYLKNDDGDGIWFFSEKACPIV